MRLLGVINFPKGSRSDHEKSPVANRTSADCKSGIEIFSLGRFSLIHPDKTEKKSAGTLKWRNENNQKKFGSKGVE